MPKTIDYPRTSYQSAWEVSEVVDDTGGKCSLETCARKLNRKVSGSFKAILGSAVKFGLLTSKREMLTTTNLFRRIKHAYDKHEELLYHREAFLHPPLFTQICRKFRGRELPVHMFDIMLIREFGVEEINAQNVAKAFVEGARMAGIIDERNIIADIDLLTAQQGPRRELAAGEMPLNLFRGSDGNPASARTSVPPSTEAPVIQASAGVLDSSPTPPVESISRTAAFVPSAVSRPAPTPPEATDPVSALFGLPQRAAETNVHAGSADTPLSGTSVPSVVRDAAARTAAPPATEEPVAPQSGYVIRINGPGINTDLHVQDTDDLEIVRILIEKIRKQLNT